MTLDGVQTKWIMSFKSLNAVLAIFWGAQDGPDQEMDEHDEDESDSEDESEGGSEGGSDGRPEKVGACLACIQRRMQIAWLYSQRLGFASTELRRWIIDFLLSGLQHQGRWDSVV